MNFTIVGGDRRYLTVAEQLSDIGSVRAFGVEGAVGRSGVVLCGSMRTALYGADTVILPIPAVSADGCINVFSEQRTSAFEFALLVPGNATVIGGMLGGELSECLQSRGIKAIDCCADEEFMLKNACISAEGALTALMGKTGRTVCGDKIGIVGYGRIGRRLTELLLSLGAEVCVTARRGEALSLAASDGAEAVEMDCIDGEYCVSDAFLESVTAVFNTVPARVLRLNPACKTVLIELASMPGGFDLTAARKLGLNAQAFRGIPGRYAPESAGKAIADCVCRALKAEGKL